MKNKIIEAQTIDVRIVLKLTSFFPMSLILLFIVISLIYLVSYIPGRIIASFLPFSYPVKFSVSFGISYFSFFLAGFGAYVFKIPYRIEWLTVSIIFLIAAVVIYKAKLFKITTNEIKLLTLFFLVFIFLIAVQGLTPYYSGAGSYWDWFEHYQRSNIFFKNLDTQSRIGGYLLPQRQPLANAAAAFLFSGFGTEFWVYQIIFTLFNASVLLPCFLICLLFFPRQEAGRLKKHMEVKLFTILSVLFLLNPFFTSLIVTFTITKAITTYFCLMGFYFLLYEYKHKNPLALYLASFFLGLGVITHFIALLYTVVCVLLLFIISIRHKHLVHFFCSQIVLLISSGIWFLWSIITYGTDLTFFHNRPVETALMMPLGERLNYSVYNLFFSIFPFLSEFYLERTRNEINYLVMVYDRIISFYSTNIPGALTISLSISFAIAIFLYLFNKKGKEKDLFQLFILTAFALSGFSNLLWPWRKEGGVVSWMLVPTVFLLFSFAPLVLNLLVKKWGKVFVSIFIIAVAVEALIGIGFKLYVGQTQLDPKINLRINLKTQLLDLPESAQYENFAVHLQNYKLKSDHNLIDLYDKFSNLRMLFNLLTVGSGVLAVYILSKRLFEFERL